MSEEAGPLSQFVGITAANLELEEECRFVTFNLRLALSDALSPLPIARVTTAFVQTDKDGTPMANASVWIEAAMPMGFMS